jgi:hypothetical protein
VSQSEKLCEKPSVPSTKEVKAIMKKLSYRHGDEQERVKNGISYYFSSAFTALSKKFSPFASSMLVEAVRRNIFP